MRLQKHIGNELHRMSAAHLALLEKRPWLEVKSKDKVKCSLVQALRLFRGRTARRGSRGIALSFLTTAPEGGEAW